LGEADTEATMAAVRDEVLGVARGHELRDCARPGMNQKDP
jgi:hypothetical protein